MRHKFMKRRSFLLLSLASIFATSAFAEEPGFTSLFNGKDLTGWVQPAKKGEGYGVKDGLIFCSKGGGGNLLTEKEFSNFVFRFEFKLAPGSNNGVGIRTPLQGDAAYVGMEIQILEDSAPKWAKLRPEQYHGSIYNVIPAKRGALKPAGEWNEEEITADGRRIKVVVNGKTVVDADLDTIKDPAVLKKHPGLLRTSGHIGFLGHNDYVEFRNIRIKELPATPSAAKSAAK